MAAARPRAWTIEEFLAFEAEEPERHEFVGGVVPHDDRWDRRPQRDQG